jgi:uncharacterized membrane protein
MTVLKRSTRILRGTDLTGIITSIEELPDNDKTRAFFLGQLIKYRSTELTESSLTIKKLHEYISNNNLTKPFNQTFVPGSKTSLLDALFILFGLFLIAGGAFEIKHNFITVGVDSKYHFFQVRGGGYTIVFALILVTIGVMRLKYFYKRTELLRRITTQNSN